MLVERQHWEISDVLVVEALQEGCTVVGTRVTLGTIPKRRVARVYAVWF
jgi:hypothetical protein